jgi:hypothetical protein
MLRQKFCFPATHKIYIFGSVFAHTSFLSQTPSKILNYRLFLLAYSQRLNDIDLENLAWSEQEVGQSASKINFSILRSFFKLKDLLSG